MATGVVVDAHASAVSAITEYSAAVEQAHNAHGRALMDGQSILAPGRRKEADGSSRQVGRRREQRPPPQYVSKNGSGNMIRGNAVNGNFNGFGIQSLNNTAEDNTVAASRLTGISISAIGAGSSVQRNMVFGSRLLDMTDETVACGTNTWSGNTFQTDEAGGIPDGGPSVPCIQ